MFININEIQGGAMYQKKIGHVKYIIKDAINEHESLKRKNKATAEPKQMLYKYCIQKNIES